MDSKNKKLEEIAQSILDRLKKETYSRNPTVGRAEAIFDGEEKLYWVVRQLENHHQYKKDIKGNIIGIDPLHDYNIEDYINVVEEVIPRDGKFGEVLSKRKLGIQNYKSLGNDITTEIKSVGDFLPKFEHYEIDATDLNLVYDEESLIGIRSLIKLLEKRNIILQKKNILSEEINKQKDETLKRELEKELEELIKAEKDMLDKQNSIQQHIRSSNELRAIPFLDETQENIKRNKVFNGPIIINGGPGTGKTTALIQRITFLVHTTILEYKSDFTEYEKDLLFNQNTSWLFFTPTELLRLYLQNAMVKEGLQSDNRRVTLWSLHKELLFREFGYINSKSKKGFKYSANQERVFKNDILTISGLIENYENFFLQNIRNIHNQTIEFQFTSQNINTLAVKIIEVLNNNSSLNSFEDLIKIYIELEKFKASAIDLRLELSLKLKGISSNMQIEVMKNTELIVKLKKLYESDLIEKELDQEVIDDQDLISDEEDEDEIQLENKKMGKNDDEIFKLKFNKSLINLIRKISLQKKSVKIKFTKLEKEVQILLETYLEKIDYNEFSELAIFKRFFYNLTRGIEVNVINKLSNSYKIYRRKVLLESGFIKPRNLEVLRSSVKSGNNRLFSDEIDFVLYIILKIINKIFFISENYFNTSEAKSISVYKDNMKMVIAIDEAIDFTPLELGCMTYLSYPKYRCVTLVGDVMQRMENEGITDWNSFVSMNNDVEIFDLNLSYRQSPTLLKIAEKLFEDQTNKRPNFISAYSDASKDFYPLKLIQNQLSEKMHWLSNRFLEINGLCPNLPSIAVFVPNDEKVKTITDELNRIDELIVNGLQAVACLNGQILGDAQKIRVFNIQHIKGLEFEAVFFLDIDDYFNIEQELVSRYLYVGLTRATMFLGVQANYKFPNHLKSIEPFFEDGGWI